jgi:hypothetical protein
MADQSLGVIYEYDPSQRAYLLDCGKEAESIELKITASENSPVINPAFLINNWGTDDAILEVNGSKIDRGTDFRFGFYETLETDDHVEWKDVLVVWVQMESFEPVKIKLLHD